jgi:hypothetical protein
MKCKILILALAFSFTNSQVTHAKDKKSEEKSEWGSPITMKKSTSIDEAMKNFDSKNKSEILVEAKVDKVCKKKGCWMVLKSKDKNVRVTFKDYGFFVPSKLFDKKVLVQGKLIEHEMDLAEAKHFASDAGEDPKRIKSPVKEFRMVSSGVKLVK